MCGSTLKKKTFVLLDSRLKVFQGLASGETKKKKRKKNTKKKKKKREKKKTKKKKTRYRGVSLIRNPCLLRPYSRPMPRTLWWS